MSLLIWDLGSEYRFSCCVIHELLKVLGSILKEKYDSFLRYMNAFGQVHSRFLCMRFSVEFFFWLLLWHVVIRILSTGKVGTLLGKAWAAFVQAVHRGFFLAFFWLICSECTFLQPLQVFRSMWWCHKCVIRYSSSGAELRNICLLESLASLFQLWSNGEDHSVDRRPLQCSIALTNGNSCLQVSVLFGTSSN